MEGAGTPMRQKLPTESQRAREFYRYFEPIRSRTLEGPAFCDLGSNASVAAHTPVSSPDPALTAFCQLGAFRVGVRRAMMFFFDQNYAYVLAEATRSLSLLDESTRDIEDSIWLGHAKIPRGYSVCEHTAYNIQPRPDSPDASLVHIINDLRDDISFCDSPFVKSGPKARFYAGVPITSPRGINIGAYCLLDDKPRDSLSEAELKFVRQISITVMNHLDMVRAKAQHERATKMVAGIGSFVDGASDLGRGMNEESSNVLRSRLNGAPSRPQSLRGDHAPSSAWLSENRKGSDDSNSGHGRQNSSHTASSTPPPDRVSAQPSPAHDGSRTQPLESKDISSADDAKASKRADDLKAELVSSNLRSMFERAAVIVRTSIGLHGALFLDASIASYGGLTEAADQSAHSDQASDTAQSSADDAKVGNRWRQDKGSAGAEASGNVCPVLGASHLSGKYGDQDVAPGSQIDETFLKKLLRRYPRGNTWNFSADGISSSDEDSLNDSLSPELDPVLAAPARKKDRKSSRKEDGRRIAQHFPGVRSLAIIGIWNQVSGRWHAASIVWTYDEFQPLSEDLDIPFLQAFNDVLMAEVHRIEAQKSDRAKVDFISSISHELRSPLHGILGSVECVQEQGTDEPTASLVSQIEACGRTLLDIVDHLLDFSKINYYGRTTQKNIQGDSSNRQRQLTGAGKMSQLGSMMSLDTEVSLDVVTEEVVGSTFYSFCCSLDRDDARKRNVAVTMDIQRGDDVNWWCRIALGGWKRIIINLVGNALKYTSSGHIHVALKRQAGQKKGTHAAQLTVKDTGQGMSKAFLQNGLFSAFSQENTFQEGVGLGMNLVSTIVKAVGGRIEVQSEQDAGTSVMVRIPLDEAFPQPSPVDEYEEPGLPEGLIVAMPTVADDMFSATVGISASKATSQKLLIGSVVKTCSELGIRTVTWDETNPLTADVLLCTESQMSQVDLAALQRPDESVPDALSTTRKPLIVLCNSIVTLRDFRLSYSDLFKSRYVEAIPQPVGPHRLSKAIRTCLAASANAAHSNADGGAPQEASMVVPSVDQSSARPARRPQTSSRHQGSDQAAPTAPISNSAAPIATLDSASLDRPASNSPPPERSETPRAADPKNRLRESSNTPARSAQRKQQQQLAVPSSDLTLMLVDDNAINLQLLATYAKKHGHAYISAHNGEQAVDAYKAACTGEPLPPHIAAIQTANVGPVPAKPRVILMDINMPVLNGYEATRAIREFERSRELTPVTVIALTGLGSADAQQEAFSSGVDLFLTKPVKLKELGKIFDGIERT